LYVVASFDRVFCSVVIKYLTKSNGHFKVNKKVLRLKLDFTEKQDLAVI